MKIFHRPEVWLLLLLAAAASIFVMLSSRNSEELALIRNPIPATAEPATIRSRSLERDFGNARLDLEVRATNPSAKAAQLVPPFAKLTNASGREVPAFFLPIEPPPSLPPKTTADIRLRFWLEPEDFTGPLTLELNGQKLPVKSAKPFDLSRLENAKLTVLVGESWGLR